MERQQILKSIERNIGCWPTQTKVAEYWNIARDRARIVLKDTPHRDNGKQKNYFSEDIADLTVQMVTQGTLFWENLGLLEVEEP